MPVAVRHTLAERVQTVLAGLVYRNWELECMETPGEVRVEARVWAVNSFDQQSDVKLHVKMSTWVPPAATDEDIRGITFDLVRWLEMHEAGEFFQTTEGVALFNSHNGSKAPLVYRGVPTIPNDIGANYMRKKERRP
jgi:hypothetical protein